MVTLVEEEPSDNLTSSLGEEEEASEGVTGDIAEQFMAAGMGVPSPCTTGEQEAKRGAELSPPKKNVNWDPSIPKTKDKKDKRSKPKEKTIISPEPGLEYGGMRLAELEDTIDPAVRSLMEVIRKDQYRKFQTYNGKEFFLEYTLPSAQEKSIQELLAEYSDVFAWSHIDLKGVNPLLGEHSIDLMLGARSIRQRQHRMNPLSCRYALPSVHIGVLGMTAMSFVS
ncbi:unnamed protein product [Calypogeia fissa]